MRTMQTFGSAGPPSGGPGVPGDRRPGDRDARWAFLLLLPGLPLVLVATAAWQLGVGTASMGGPEEDLQRGWTGVAYNLPVYLLAVLVTGASLFLAARARRAWPLRGRGGLVAGGLGLLFALASSTRDAAEVVMTTRAATVSWMLFGLDAVIAGAVWWAARRWSERTG